MKATLIVSAQPIKQRDLPHMTVFRDQIETESSEGWLYLRIEAGAIQLTGPTPGVVLPDREHGDELCIIVGRLEVEQ